MQPIPNTPRNWPALELRAAVSSLPGSDLSGVRLTNAELAGVMAEGARSLREHGVQREIPPCDPAFPFERIGIESRCVLDQELTSRDLAIDVARKALERSGTPADAIVATVVSTVSPDKRFPAVATSIADALELSPTTAAFDTGMGCNGFTIALDLASRQLFEHDEGAAVLVVASETMTRLCDLNDRGTCPIFGDGAGAVVVARSRESRLGRVRHWTLGKGGTYIYSSQTNEHGAEPLYRLRVRQGQARAEEERDDRIRVVLDGRRVYRDMVRRVPRFVEELLAGEGLELDDVDRFAFHQANQRMVEAICGPFGLDVDTERVLTNIAQVGNTASASIPILLAQAAERRELKTDERVLLMGFGTGYSIGATIVRWS